MGEEIENQEENTYLDIHSFPIVWGKGFIAEGVGFCMRICDCGEVGGS